MNPAKERLEKLGRTQAWLVDKVREAGCRMTAGHMSSILNDHSRPSWRVARAICDALSDRKTKLDPVGLMERDMRPRADRPAA